MIGRRTAKLLSTIIGEEFSRVSSTAGHRSEYAKSSEIYDFLYERDHEPYICNLLKGAYTRSHLEDKIKKLQTTESLSTGGKWTQRQKVDYCQRVLKKLAEDVLASDFADPADLEALRRALELDGYAFTEGKLRTSEGESKDVEQERGELLSLYVSMGLANEPVVRDCLKKSEEHYGAGAYRDCISNARHFLEQVVHDVAQAWSARPGEPALVIPPKAPAAGPARNYLRDNGVISTDECAAFAALHGLLSATGGHPALPEAEQARVFRRLALSMALFVLLVYKAKR